MIKKIFIKNYLIFSTNHAIIIVTNEVTKYASFGCSYNIIPIMWCRCSSSIVFYKHIQHNTHYVEYHRYSLNKYIILTEWVVPRVIHKKLSRAWALEPVPFNRFIRLWYRLFFFKVIWCNWAKTEVILIWKKHYRIK